jgi:hypothetical protein
MRRICALTIAVVLLACMTPWVVRGAASGVATVTTDKEAYAAGDTVRLTYQVTNTSTESLDLTFASGQRYDFTVRGDALFFRWSKGRYFTDVMGYESIEPGETLSFSSAWRIPAGTNAGWYTVSFGIVQRDPFYVATTTFRIGDPGASQSPSFPDVAASFARLSIDRLYAQKLITGYKDGLFRPMGLVTRAEGAVLAARARQLTVGGSISSPWPDMTARHWAYPMVLALLDVGNGEALSWVIGLFEPSKPITRIQFVMCLLAPADQSVALESPFADVSSAAPGGREVTIAYQQGIVMGTIVGDTSVFEPDRFITRAEAAVVIDRFLTGPASTD